MQKWENGNPELGVRVRARARVWVRVRVIGLLRLVRVGLLG